MSQIGNKTAYQDAPYFEAVGNGSTQAYTLTWTPGFANAIQVYVGGVPQPTSAYTVFGTTLTLSSVPQNGARVLVFGRGLNAILGVPSDGSVTSAKLDQSTLVLPATATTPTLAITDDSNKLASTAYVNNFVDNTLQTQPFSFRNKLINGGMQVAQRGTGPISVAGSTTYTLDRWVGYAVGANFTVNRVAYTNNGFSHGLVCTGAASNTLAQISQRIESLNTFDLLGKTVTVSGLFFLTDAGNINWTLRSANAPDNFTTVTAISSGSITIPAANYTYRSFQVAIPSNYNCNGLDLVFYVNGLAATKQMAFANIQLEAGSIATPFEQRPIQVELAMCQRYYCCASNTNDGNGFYGTTTAGHGYRSYGRFPVTMRASPTVLLTHAGGGGFPAAPAAPTVGLNGYMEDRIASSSGNNAYASTYTASSEL